MTTVLESSVSAPPAAELLEIEERERHATSTALHDGPVQGVVAMRLLVDLAAAALHRGDVEQAAARLADLGEATRSGLAEVRRAMRGLHGRCLDGHGISAAIEAHAGAVQADGGPATQVEVDWHHPLSPATAIAIQRVAQAALADAQSRRAKTASVEVHPGEGGIRLTVLDDGAGPGPTATGVDSGLARWAARVPLIGGRFELTTSLGWHQVTCWFPLADSAIGGHRP